MNDSPISFYNTYHLKNDKYVKKISFNNFTYYYILRFLQKAYEHFAAPPLVLDVGCGVGSILLFLSDFSLADVGLDLSERAILIAKSAAAATNSKNVIFKQGQLPFFRNCFDLVIATEVIEHVPNDEDFISKIDAALKNDGLLLLSTPLSDNIFVKTKLYKNFDKEVGHLRRYTQFSIFNLLQKHGFKIIESKKIESPMRNLLYLTRLGLLIRFIKGPLVPMFHWLDEALISLLGASNIIIIAQKKHVDSSFLS